MNILELKPHPLAAEMPALAKHEAQALEDSLESQGFDEGLPIVVWTDPAIGEPRVLDGVNRLAKAKKLGLSRIAWRPFEGDAKAAAEFVFSRQMGRRSPDASQRAAIMALHRRRMKEYGVEIGLEEAKDRAGVSISQMEKASAVAAKSKKFATKVVRGELTVARAAGKLKRAVPEEHDDDPKVEIERTTEKLKGAIDALEKWASEYLDPVLDRRGAEMLKANLSSRGRVVAGKRVLGLALIEEMIQTIKRNIKKDWCKTCNGAGCADCHDRRYVTAHEYAQTKNAERNGKK